MTSKKNWVLAAALLAAAGTAGADEFSSTITVTSDYDFRGVSQTAKDPALQASLDYAADSGVYFGAWASNVDFGGEESLEIDGYLGWAYEGENGIAWDFGYVRYLYPDDAADVDYDEVYAKVGYGNYGVELWYSPDYGQTGKETWYYAGNADFELAESWALNLHVGYNTGQYYEQGWGSGPGAADGSYWEYSVGVTKTWGNFDVNLRYQGVDVPNEYKVTDDLLNSESRVILSVSTTLPWGE
jgi:uncharacterized protein (TIGR02001 family)